MSSDSEISKEKREARFLRESGLEFFDILCSKDHISVDVGANKGAYTEKMLPHSLRTYAYEPLPEFARALEQKFKNSNVIIRECTLSDVIGKATLYTPEYKDPILGLETLYSWSSLAKDFSAEKSKYPERFVDVHEREIETTTLDQEGLSPVGFVKIDVEGAEEEVLRGAARILVEQKPVLLVEIEERHRQGAIADITGYLSSFGYQGFFIDEDTIKSISNFSVETMQANQPFPHIKIRGQRNLNNFIFVPAGKESCVDAIRERLLVKPLE